MDQQRKIFYVAHAVSGERALRKREINRRYARSPKGRATQNRYAARADRIEATKLKVARSAELFRLFLQEQKSKPCADCGGRFDPVCMDFDHRAGETKLFGIAHGRSRRREVVLAEIAKCDLVCANCHRIRTHRLRDNAPAGRSSATEKSTQLSLIPEAA